MRHWFHQHPELTWQETNTAERIRQCLNDWQIDWRACATHGSVATLAPLAKGPHIALRADMDALPIQEKTSLSFSSSEDGKMHACGHDGHMAALLGAASYLKYKEHELPGPVSLLFQPAEEGGHGAKQMIEDGALKGIDMIFGWHNWPAMFLGQAACPDGAIMSGNGTFHITVTGKGGHASQPEACKDPLLASAAITLNLQQIISRRLPPQAAAVVSVTRLIADSTPTITPDKVNLDGSIRLSDPKWRQSINDAIIQIVQDTAKTYGVEVEIEIRPRYEATINHAQAASIYRDALEDILGKKYATSEILLPVMASEDFSYYLEQIPGAFALIGMAQKEGKNIQYQHPLHNPNYQFNDDLIENIMKVFIKLVGITPP